MIQRIWNTGVFKGFLRICYILKIFIWEYFFLYGSNSLQSKYAYQTPFTVCMALEWNEKLWYNKYARREIIFYSNPLLVLTSPSSPFGCRLLLFLAHVSYIYFICTWHNACVISPHQICQAFIMKIHLYLLNIIHRVF